MTTIAAEIADIEATLTLQRIPLERLFVEAEIDRSTWTRWRARKNSPRLDNWLAVKAAAGRLVEAASSAASPDAASIGHAQP